MYCPHCQYKNDKGATVCARCGKSLSEEASAAKVPESKQAKGLSTGALIGIIAAVVVVLAAIIVVVMLVLPGSESVNAESQANVNAQNVATDDSNSNENVADNTSSTATNEAVNEVVESKGVNNVVDFLTTSTDGTVLSGKIHRDASDYVIAKSSVTVYSTSQLSSMGLTDAELCIAWWEPYAAKGVHFKNSALNKYFSGCSWYKDKGYKYTDIQLDNPTRTNIYRLKALVSKSSPWLSLSES